MKTKIIGCLLIIMGLSINVYTLIEKKENISIEKRKIEYTLEKEISYNFKEDTYNSIIKIPKINLIKGIYDITDERNNLDRVMIHRDSIYPDKDNSNIILMGHSGSGDKAVFNDLDKMNSDTLIEFYYNHSKYVYRLDHSYYIEKNDKAIIKRNMNKKTITLITCDKKDKTKQVVYIGYLIDTLEY